MGAAMSTVILLLAVALTLHVMPPVVPDALLTVQYLWAPVGLSVVSVVLAIAADSLRHAERGR